jgi:hypothetical protein
MRMKLLLLIIGASLFVGTGRLLAHHAFSAEFDANKPMKLKGTVTKMEWVNPHAWIHLEVKAPDGKVVEWLIEGAAPNAMIRRGFTKDSLPAGTEIIVEGFQAKDGSNTGNGRNLTFADGRTLFIGSSGTGSPEGAAEEK